MAFFKDIISDARRDRAKTTSWLKDAIDYSNFTGLPDISHQNEPLAVHNDKQDEGMKSSGPDSAMTPPENTVKTINPIIKQTDSLNDPESESKTSEGLQDRPAGVENSELIMKDSRKIMLNPENEVSQGKITDDNDRSESISEMSEGVLKKTEKTFHPFQEIIHTKQNSEYRNNNSESGKKKARGADDLQSDNTGTKKRSSVNSESIYESKVLNKPEKINHLKNQEISLLEHGIAPQRRKTVERIVKTEIKAKEPEMNQNTLEERSILKKDEPLDNYEKDVWLKAQTISERQKNTKNTVAEKEPKKPLPKVYIGQVDVIVQTADGRDKNIQRKNRTAKIYPVSPGRRYSGGL